MKLDDLYSSPKRTHALGIRRVRLAGTINLLAWPVAGAFYWAGMPLFGLLCVLIALISFGAIIGTGVHRIAFGQATTEEDIALQMAANAKGYGIVAAGVAITLCVALIGYDTLRVNAPQWLVFETYDVLSFIFWAFLNVMVVLPAIVLAWSLPTPSNGTTQS